MNGDPAKINWRSVCWNVRLHNRAILQVQGAGTGKWGSEWSAVGSGAPAIVSWNGIGTGRGPVVVYQRSNNVWTVVLVDYNSGALENIRHFNQRITPMSGGEYGATIRSGNKCYDYSWDHLKEISCKSKNFIFGGTQSSVTKKKNEPDDEPDEDPAVIGTGTNISGSGQSQSGGETPKKKKNDQPSTVIPKNQCPEDVPDWFQYLAVVADSDKNYDPWTFEFGDTAKIKLIRTDTKQQFSAEFMLFSDVGEFTDGNTYHASKAGIGQISFKKYKIPYRPKGGGDPKTFDFDYEDKKEILTLFTVFVNPPLEPFSHWPSDKNMIAVTINICDTDGEPVGRKGWLISLQGETTPEITKEANLNIGRPHAEFTVGELRHLPPAVYTIYVYLQTDYVGSDMHAIKKYQVALPVQKGSGWHKTVVADFAAKLWVVPPPQHLPAGDK